ncbi:MAG: transaldolase [Phycisphaerales bacterium]|nr:transaldolase [Phycisphaerales bacterium]
MIHRTKQITSLGQSLWIDFISREMLRGGRLAQLIEHGITGLTSNPSIFQKSIAGGAEYDAEIRELSRTGRSDYEIYETLALRDIADAADLMRPVFNETHGRDGFVSIEVNPEFAHDTERTTAEGHRLFAAIRRPNVMIKVPATEAGLPSISALLGEGINVNVTLIFGVEMYERVMQAYLDGLRAYQRRGGAPANVSSVASFFVSRVDTAIDKMLEAHTGDGEDEAESLLGQAGIANAKIAYARFKAVFNGEQFNDLRAAGARVQRPLWASTSTKNPAYSPTMYVDNLIGPNTVNTLPPQTFDALRDAGTVAQSIEQEVDAAYALFRQLSELGIEVRAVSDQLLVDGVKLFADSFQMLLKDIATKRAKLDHQAA